MDVLIHIACLLRLYSSFQRDLLRLRLFTLIAAMCLIVYFATQPEPMLTVVAWNGFFLVVNLAQVSVTMARRRRRRARRRARLGSKPPVVAQPV